LDSSSVTSIISTGWVHEKSFTDDGEEIAGRVGEEEEEDEAEEEDEEEEAEADRTGDDVSIFIRSLQANSADCRDVDEKEDEWLACKERGTRAFE
jgi:hypothetical protein